MRTTISIDDALLRQAKSAAALQGKTLSELVEENLRNGLNAEGGFRPPYVVKGSGGTRPGIDLSSNASIWSILDEEDLENYQKIAGQHASDRRKHPDKRGT